MSLDYVKFSNGFEKFMPKEYRDMVEHGPFGKKVTVMTDGKERDIIVDEEYLRRSIVDPGADIVKGYPPVMPTLPVTKDELQEIVAYLKELK